MRALAFTKGHGTKNDFVLLYDPSGEIALTPDLVRWLCDRRGGIGADGVIRAVRAWAIEAGKGLAPDAWFMDYWNADGSLSEMCGNGARVFGAYLELMTEQDLSGGLTFGTRGGPRTVTSLGDGRYAIGMGEWRVEQGTEAASVVTAAGLAHAREALSVDVGNPHRVVALGSDAELEALRLHDAPEVSPRPPAGANVEFVVTRPAVATDHGPRGRARMRVHERGSGETMSCGTGACAVAIALHTWAGEGAPTVWDIDVPGGQVTVRIEGTTTVLEGPAELVAQGTVAMPN